MSDVFEFRGGPRDGELLDTRPEPLDLTDPLGFYTIGPRVTDRRTGEPRVHLRWSIAPGGTRNPPACPEPCSPGCPANGLAGT